jgi:hypothetical protein
MHNKQNIFCMKIALAVIAAAIMHKGAMAQGVQPETPPELRDFRLDAKPKEPPAPNAEPKEAVQVPIVPANGEAKQSEEFIREAQDASVPQVPKSLPKVERRAKRAIAASKREIPPPKANVPSKAEDPSFGTEATESAPIAKEPATVPADIATPKAEANASGAFPWWIAALFLALAALIGFFIWRRPAARASEEAKADWQEADAPGPKSIASSEETAPVPRIKKPKSSNISRLEGGFVPQNAQLSLANLTISGRLSLKNISNGPLRDISVRTTMISAHEGQNEIIRQFHADHSYGHRETIGDMKAGEEIALSIEIQQPRRELSEFDWQERRFMAPIVLINLSGKGPDGKETCQLSCLIGRESAPATQRMKPFHTDRGPRRFEGLAFHPVAI